MTKPCPIGLTAAGDGRPHVLASPERLSQVFENLLVNACGFSPPGTGVSVLVADDPGFCRVTVSDRGPGIPPEHLERIFDRFFTYRPHDPAGRREHAGLGLAIARAIVEGYGGSVTVANRPEGGAEFEIRLPATRMRPAGTAAATRPVSMTGSA
jgi:signal transduction histidine kinase